MNTVDDCLSPEVLGLRDCDRSDVLESFDTRDSDEPLGDWPGRCAFGYGLRLLEVRLGRGEYGLLAGWGVELPDA